MHVRQWHNTVVSSWTLKFTSHGDIDNDAAKKKPASASSIQRRANFFCKYCFHFWNLSNGKSLYYCYDVACPPNKKAITERRFLEVDVIYLNCSLKNTYKWNLKFVSLINWLSTHLPPTFCAILGFFLGKVKSESAVGLAWTIFDAAFELD